VKAFGGGTSKKMNNFGETMATSKAPGAKRTGRSSQKKTGRPEVAFGKKGEKPPRPGEAIRVDPSPRKKKLRTKYRGKGTQSRRKRKKGCALQSFHQKKQGRRETLSHAITKTCA